MGMQCADIPGTKRQNRYRHQAKEQSLFVAYSDSLGFTLGFTSCMGGVTFCETSVNPCESEYTTT